MLLQGAVPRAELLGQGVPVGVLGEGALLPRPVRVRLRLGRPGVHREGLPGHRAPPVRQRDLQRSAAARVGGPDHLRGGRRPEAAVRQGRAVLGARRVRQGLYVLVRGGVAGADCSDVRASAAAGDGHLRPGRVPLRRGIDGAALRVASCPGSNGRECSATASAPATGASASTAGRARRATSRCARRLRPPRQVRRRRVRVRRGVVGASATRTRARTTATTAAPASMRRASARPATAAPTARARVPRQAPGRAGLPAPTATARASACRAGSARASRATPAPTARSARASTAARRGATATTARAGARRYTGAWCQRPTCPTACGRRAVLGARRVPRVCVRVRARVAADCSQKLCEQLRWGRRVRRRRVPLRPRPPRRGVRERLCQGRGGRVLGARRLRGGATAANATHPERVCFCAPGWGGHDCSPRSARVLRARLPSTARASAPTASAAPTARRRSRPTSRRSRVRVQQQVHAHVLRGARAWWGRRTRRR